MTATAFDRVQTARHPDRPYAKDLLTSVFSDFVEVHGDRRFADDPAMIAGFARLGDMEVCVVGQQKGRDLNERRFRNFAMPKPEGYRKALRVMRLAEKFGRPIVTMIDTPGAYPGIDAEERGQAEAIAFNLREMARLKVPIVVLVLGEGGSGGALAIGIGDKVLMMENAVYSVISPEGCAAILWKDAAMAPEAASGLKLTAGDLLRLGIVDRIIPEPTPWTIASGSAENGDNDFSEIARTVAEALKDEIGKLLLLSHSDLVSQRYEKFRKMGEWIG
jgi:acetyl-CoA carboxylase carboxyl transferase subunit alpha